MKQHKSSEINNKNGQIKGVRILIYNEAGCDLLWLTTLIVSQEGM